MKLSNVYKLLIENDGYGEGHTAPDTTDSPIYDVEDSFPDFYSEKGQKYYDVGLDSYSTISMIQSLHNRPKASVKIYRAVPDINKEINKEISSLGDVLGYHNKYGFYPRGNKLVDKIEDQFKGVKGYVEKMEAMKSYMHTEFDNLYSQRKKVIKINNGDWVTTSKLYAKEHGQSNLGNNFKIATKTVKASQLFSDGNSIFEWGYNIT